MGSTTDTSGNLYFVDPLAGAAFKLDPSGTITRIAGTSRTEFSGDGGPAISASLNSPRSVAVDGAGNVYILDSGNQRVRRVTADGMISTYAGGGSAVLGDGGPATSGQLNYPNAVAVDSAGNIFIGEYGRVRKVSPDGIITTIAGGGATDPADGVPATSARLTYVPALAADGLGNLYIGNEILLNGTADTNLYSVFKVSPSGVLATLPPVPGSTGVPGGAGIYTFPYHAQIAADRAGNLFLPANTLLWKITPGGSESVVAGTGGFGIGGDGGPASQAQLNALVALAADTAGNLYIADSGGRAIRKISPDGIIRPAAAIGNFGGIPQPPPSGDGGPATSAQLEFVVPGQGSLGYEGGMATDGAGNVYFAETAAGRIRKVSSGGTIATVAGVGGPPCPAPPNCLPLGDGGPATSASLSYPTGVAVDGNGNLFIADMGHSVLRKVAPDGTISTFLDNEGNPLNATGITVDASGNVVIFGTGNVRRISPDGTVATLASGYINLFSAALDRAGNLFAAIEQCDGDDEFNCWNVIQKIAPDGTTTPIAGCSTCTTYKEGGPAIQSSVGVAPAMVVNASGDLVITDVFHGVVRRIDASGIITTIAGNGAYGYSGDGSSAIGASMSYVTGLATDASGNLYLSDTANEAVRVLRPSGH